MFLGHESTHEKLCSRIPHPISAHPQNNANEQKKTGRKLTIAHSIIGKESIFQTVSALEHWQFNHAHLYQDNPDVQDPLHSDSQAKMIKTAKKHNDPKHIESAQVLKATSCSSGQPFHSMPTGFSLP